MRYGRKASGGRYKKQKKKKLCERAGTPRLVILGKEKKKSMRLLGGGKKTVLLSQEKANVLDKKTNKHKIAKITTVKETPSNRFMARRNIMMKGAIIETELGKARITNRPGQEGQINAVLVEEK
jgi:small subunit ribosomal protein S8e